MADRGRNPQIDDPELAADFGRSLSIRGTLGIFNVSDAVLPVVPIPGPRALPTSGPTFGAADVVTVSTAAPAIGTVLATTPPLQSGRHAVLGSFHTDEAASGTIIQFRHHDAAGASLAVIEQFLAINAGHIFLQALTWEVAEGETLKWATTFAAATAATNYVASIKARRVA